MWKRRKQPSAPPPAQQFFTKINARIRAAQRKLADRLNKRTAHWRRRHQIYFLVIVLAVHAGIQLIPIGGGRSQTSSLHQTAETVTLPRSFRGARGGGFTAKDSSAFLTLRHRLDSALASAEGRAYIRELYQLRPGFLDSVLEVERKILSTLPPIVIPDSLKNDNHE